MTSLTATQDAEAPGPDWSVRKFAVWWMRRKPFKPPHDAVSHKDIFAATTLYREGQFQVQLVIVKPNAHVPPHAHPNVDSEEVFFFDGGGDIHVGGATSTPSHLFTPIAHGEVHGAHVGARGGAFLSIQKWLNGLAPMSLELDWGGDPLDTIHAKELSH